MARWRWCVPVAASLALALAGCGSSAKSAGPSGSTPSAAPTSTTTTTHGGSAATTPQAAPTSSAPAATSSAATTPPQCATSQLSGRLSTGNGAAGTIYYQLELTNTSGSTCTEQGYAGVSFVAGADGHQVGAAARRSPGTDDVVTLVPGATTYATLGIADAADYDPGSCRITDVRGLRVYPPNQTAALYVVHADQGCANTSDGTLSISPFDAAPPA